MLALAHSRRYLITFAAAIAVGLIATPHARQATPAPPRAATPAVQTGLAPIADAEFWRLTSDLSEPDGTFHSENLVSNETRFQTIVPDLVRRVTPGRAYVGVGSEQNFTYIAATRPSHVFILDIRHGNLDLHLLYKAFFELSADRAEFVARMFGRPRPAGLTTASTAQEIFSAFGRVAPNEPFHDRTYDAAVAHLATNHGFKLSDGDRQGLKYVYDAWFTSGPDISYQLTGGFGRGGGGASYATLMTSDDGSGRNWSYLADEESFRFLKDLESRNRIVPVVGNFGGPKALRAVATYLKAHQMIVSTFYTSNVQQDPIQDGIWNTFCASASTLPMDQTSTMIRSERGGFSGAAPVPGGGFRVELLPLGGVVAGCAPR